MRALLGKIWRNFNEKRILRKALRSRVKKMKDRRRQEIANKYILTKEQEKQIDKLYLSTYGKKIPYDWHKFYSAYTKNFDVNYIPELIFLPIIEKKFNNQKYVSAFSDKNLLPFYVSGLENVKTPKIFLSSANGFYRDENYNLITKDQAINLLSNLRCFGKPTVDSNSGNMCAVYNFENGIDIISKKTVEQVIDNMGKNFCFQELISNCESVRRLHENSLNTFRITTYLWNDKVWHAPMVMRIGQGNSLLDNVHQGGMFIGVSDSGELAECAFTEFLDKFYVHPDSKIEFKGYCVPEAKKALEAVKKIHQRIPQMGLVAWDVIVNEKEEVVVIEMNVFGQGPEASQKANGQGLFGENTAEILTWIGK